MSQEFKVGDIVQLKSGGPKMTVNEVLETHGEDKQDVRCAWFAGSKHEHAYFSVETLILAPEENEAK